MNILIVDDNIRLEQYDRVRKESLAWYSDKVIQWMVNQTEKLYNKDEVKNMYEWQNKHGRLYYIVYKGVTMGDVCIYEDDFAIVIDPYYHRKGIASSVIRFFIKTLRVVIVKEVYSYNIASQRLFRKLGFRETASNDNTSYIYEAE